MTETLSEHRRRARFERIRGSLSRIAGDDVAAQLAFRAETAELERQREIADATAELAGKLRASKASPSSSPPCSSSTPAPASSPPSSSPAPSSSSSAARRRRPRTEHERYQADLRWYEQRKSDLGAPPPNSEFKIVPREVWAMARACMGSQRALFFELSRERNRAAVGALRRSAFAGGVRDWQSSYAVHVLVLGLVLLRLCRRTKGERKRGRYPYNYEGIPRECLLELLKDPRNGHVPSMSALRGRHRPDASLETGQLGYLDALEAGGFLYRLQRQRPTRFRPDIKPTFNQYWIVGHSAYLSPEAIADVLQLIAESDELERPLSRGPP